MPDLPIARIIHLSDLHFGDQLENREQWWHKHLAATPLQGRYTHDYTAAISLQRILHEITQQAQDAGVPLILVHTGDLTANGAEPEFSVGQSFLRTLGEVHSIPGNHDKWGYTNQRPPHWYQNHFPTLQPIPCLNGRIILYPLDSNKHSQFIWDATGTISPQTLDQICTHIAGHPDATRIVLTHHPIHVEGPNDDPRLRLDNRDQIAHRLAAAGANLIVSGHVHISQQHEPTPLRPLQCIAGSATQIRAPKTFLVIDTYPDGFDPQEYIMGPDNHFVLPPAGLRTQPTQL